MSKNCNINILMYHEKLLNEIYDADVLLKATKCCCQEKEFRGEYYGIPQNFTQMISNERNEYLSLLTLILNKISHINTLNEHIENELTLHKNTNNSCR